MCFGRRNSNIKVALSLLSPADLLSQTDKLFLKHLTSSSMHHYLVVLLVLSLSPCQASGPLVAPQQVGLEADQDAQCLSITWGGPNAPHYDILIWRSEFMVTVFNETVEAKPDADGRFRWNWTSEEPLECTSLSVTVRARSADEISDWSRPEILAGMDVPSKAHAQMYPSSRVVKVGSNTTFCCIIAEGDSFGSISYHAKNMDFTRLSRRSYATTRTNQGPSATSGTNVVCSNSKTIVTGAVMFVGYPPQPGDLLCETHDLRSAECQWSAGPDTHLTGIKRRTYYALNGRNCSLAGGMLCGLEDWEGSWTLEAWNQLGRARLTDSAELSHRVRPLSASSLVATVIHPWNATLQWAWPNQTYASLPLICQVQLISHWHPSTQTFTGAGLDRAVLSGLQPDEEYRCRIRCGSQRSFWKWSGWSPYLTFTTSMDRPDAPDVWVWMDSNSTGRIIWKPLTKRESHGQLSSYEVTLWSSEENRQRSHVLPQRTHSQAFSLGSPAAGVRVTITATNAAGVSPSATLGIPDYLGDVEEAVSRAEASQAGFPLAWTLPDNTSCDYLLEWHNTSCSQPCALDWTRLPAGATNTTILSDTDWFQPGVRYTFSLYSCPSQHPSLHQRWEAYMQEQAPSRSSPHVSSSQQGSGVLLTWEEVLLEHQRGFLLGYRVYLANASRLSLIANITDPSQRNYTVTKLPVGSYKFTVKSYNSAGEDGGSTAFISLDPYTDWLILEILVALGTMACFLAVVTTLCYRKRKWVKTAFYPDIPEPSLPGDWSMPQGTLDLKPSPHSMVHILENPEWDSKEALVTVPEEEEEEGSAPADTDEPSALRYYNQVVDQGMPRQRPAHLPDSSASSGSSVDSARTDVTYTGIQASAPTPQPQPQPPPGGYRPQMHPASPPASVEQEQVGAEGPFGGYKPQCSWKMDSPVEGLAPSLGSPTSVTSSQFLLPDPDHQVKGQTSWFHSLLSGKP
ncbi:LIF receptor subunit alpha a isoform X1 [Osmerus mordax]|uniref:LIF receptor subunit alpha a isoform X1 n=2 Tax=Osmerus mordax TaxID=8014 RepID=UPI00350F44A7